MSEVSEAYKKLSSVVNSSSTGELEEFIELFADEHPTLQMGFYRVLNEGLRRRHKEIRMAAEGIDWEINRDALDGRVSMDVAEFAAHSYIPFV